MALPVIPDVVQAQVRMQKDSGLPEDVFINTLYFLTEPGNNAEESVSSMAAMMDAFYGNQNGTAQDSISGLIPDFVTGVEYRFYDLGDTPPRFPVIPDGSTDPFITASWVGESTATPLPEEVALCLSYHGQQNTARRRGRIYVGPLVESVVSVSSGSPRPSDLFRTVLEQSALDMVNSTEDSDWYGVSPTDAVGYEVRGGWIDNAFDTQRSRGAAATDRVTWTAT